MKRICTLLLLAVLLHLLCIRVIAEDDISMTGIAFEDALAFFDSQRNYQTIVENLNNGKIEELKTAIKDYESSHPADTFLLNTILDTLNEYGDYKNLVCDTDSFSGEVTIYYDGYTGISTDHFLYPHYTGDDSWC